MFGQKHYKTLGYKEWNEKKMLKRPYAQVWALLVFLEEVTLD